MSLLKLNTAPFREPVTLAEVKAQMRLDDGDDYTMVGTLVEDGYINDLITVARAHVESLCGPLITQTWEQYEDDWPSGNNLEIKKARLQSVTSIVYTDEDESDTTFTSTYYSTSVENEYFPRAVLKDDYDWPTATLWNDNPIKVTFVCGYGDDRADVPAPIRHAILMLVTHWFENRQPVLTSGSMGSVMPIPETVDALLANYRQWRHDL